MSRPATTLQERFEELYVPCPTSGCWLWIGTDKGKGYGTITFNKKCLIAHRVAYELAKGPIPAGLQIDHLCRNRSCVNPAHLEAVSPKENNRRSYSPTAINTQKTHCVRGHLLPTREETERKSNAKRLMRSCNTCKRLSYYRSRAKHGLPCAFTPEGEPND